MVAMSPISRRAVASLAVVSLAFTACSSGGGGNDGATGGATSSTAADGGSSNGSGDPTDLGGDGEDLATSGTGAAPTGVDPSKPVPRDDIPAVGSYVYEFSLNGGEPSERNFVVNPAGEGEGWVRQLFTLFTDEFVERQLVVWLSDRHYVEIEQRARGGSLSAACVWSPGLLVLELPLEVGATWRGDSTCESEAAKRRRVSEVRVTGTETVTIGGTAVEAVVIERTEATTTDVKTQRVKTVDKRNTTDLVWRQRGLLLRSSGSQSSTLNGAPKESFEFTTELVSLEPRSE